MPDPQQQADDLCRQGNALFRSSQIQAAVAAYQQAIAIKPDYGEVYSNLGNALLTARRLPEAIAAFRRAIELAVHLANDLKNLSELRTTLRARLKNSPLMNAKLFAKNVESAYRKMWQRYCQSLPAESFNVAEKP